MHARQSPTALLSITLMFLVAALLLPAGCPLGTTGADGADGSDTSSGDATETDGSTSDDAEASGDSESTDDSTSEDTTVDGTAGPPGTGALLVETLENAVNTYFDIYQAPARSIRSYQESNAAVYLAPGEYYLTQYFNANFRYASNLTITAGNVTTVELGAIKLATVANASDGYFDIYDSTGSTEYSGYNESNALITAPAGTFTLKEYSNTSFNYATDVTVTAGETTTVEMGGIKLITVENADDGTYAIYDSTGTTSYASYNDPNVIITAPAGTFVLKEYFNPDFTYADAVTVTAGNVTEVEMGAIRYNGTLSYDIYESGTLVSSYNEAGKIITAPPGTYTLTEYFDDTNVLKTNVVVTAGAVTDVN